MNEDVEIVDDGSDGEMEDEEADFGDADAAAPGGFDLGGLLAQAQAMQQQLLDVQAEAASQVVEGQSGGGVVKVRVRGYEFEAVEIDPSVVDPAEIEMLQDLVLAAMRDAFARVHEVNASAMGGILGGLLP